VGWDYKLIARYGELEAMGFPASVTEYTDLLKHTALPVRYRQMLYAKTSAIWNESCRQNKKKTTKAWNHFMVPSDLTSLTPLNCPALRFPSMSMLLPFRGIEAPDLQWAYHNVSVPIIRLFSKANRFTVQELRHTFSAMKSNCLKFIRARGEPEEVAKLRVNGTLSRKVTAWLNRNVPTYARSKGMHLFGAQPEVARQIAVELDQRAREAEQKGEDFFPWVEHTKVKAEFWQALHKSERKVWTQRSKECVPGPDRFLTCVLSLEPF
jgi:hypothetical protein